MPGANKKPAFSWKRRLLRMACLRPGKQDRVLSHTNAASPGYKHGPAALPAPISMSPFDFCPVQLGLESGSFQPRHCVSCVWTACPARIVRTFLLESFSALGAHFSDFYTLLLAHLRAVVQEGEWSPLSFPQHLPSYPYPHRLVTEKTPSFLTQSSQRPWVCSQPR